MKFQVLTLYTPIIEAFAQCGVIGRAVSSGAISIEAIDIRNYATDNYRSVDDYPYGGGAGMLMMAQPVCDCVRDVKKDRDVPVILFSARGKKLDSRLAREYADLDEVILLCGHFEGIDERAIQLCVDEEVSIGDYILTGGHMAAMVFIDAVSRHVPGVLGNLASTREESFEGNLCEYEQYTRPYEFEGLRVPDALLSGNHRLIAEYKKYRSLKVTQRFRPDLLAQEQRESLGESPG